MTYQEALHNHMLRLAKNKLVKFIGYNTANAHKMYGTLEDVPKESIIEMPVAENLMMGLGMGMSLEGYFPIVCFERMDFLLCAMDAIVNHLDKLVKISDGQFNFPLVVRAIVGSKEPLYPGLQHINDYTDILVKHTSIDLCQLKTIADIDNAYRDILFRTTPLILVEYKELWERSE